MVIDGQTSLMLLLAHNLSISLFTVSYKIFFSMPFWFFPSRNCRFFLVNASLLPDKHGMHEIRLS